MAGGAPRELKILNSFGNVECAAVRVYRFSHTTTRTHSILQRKNMPHAAYYINHACGPRYGHGYSCVGLSYQLARRG